MPVEPPARRVPARLVEQSAEVRAAVLVDAAGSLIASSEADRGRAHRLAELTAELVRGADAAAPDPVAEIEAHVEGGSIFAVRSARFTLACVARRLALPSLALFDLRQGLATVEAEA